MTGQNSFLRNITMLFSVFIRHTVSTSAFALGAFIIVPATAYAAESGYITPLTEFGAPDLQGTWSLATQTNLERSDRFEGKLVISQEEALLIEARVQARNEASNLPSDPDREAPSAGRNVGGYNTFWMDPGERLAVVNGEIRTSVLVDPADCLRCIAAAKLAFPCSL